VDPGPARLPPPKIPKPPMFSGEGEDLKPDKLKRWLRTVNKHLARSGLNDDSPRVADYYGAFTDGKANNAYQTLDREVEDLTLAQLTQRLQQLFEASTNVTGALCRKTDPKIATAPKTQSRSKDQNKDKDNSK